jgi:hypothetical protein
MRMSFMFELHARNKTRTIVDILVFFVVGVEQDLALGSTVRSLLCGSRSGAFEVAVATHVPLAGLRRAFAARQADPARHSEQPCRR